MKRCWGWGGDGDEIHDRVILTAQRAHSVTVAHLGCYYVTPCTDTLGGSLGGRSSCLMQRQNSRYFRCPI